MIKIKNREGEDELTSRLSMLSVHFQPLVEVPGVGLPLGFDGLLPTDFCRFDRLKERLGRRLGSNDELCVGRSFKEAEVDLYWCVVLWRGFDSFTRILDIE